MTTQVARFEPGQRVVWMHVPHGGYFSREPGWYYPVDATVTKIGRATVTIRVQRRSGELVERRVKPESLKASGAA